MKSLLAACVIVLSVSVPLMISSCQFSIQPDGSKSGLIDGEGAVRVIEALGNK